MKLNFFSLKRTYENTCGINISLKESKLTEKFEMTTLPRYSLSPGLLFIAATRKLSF